MQQQSAEHLLLLTGVLLLVITANAQQASELIYKTLIQHILYATGIVVPPISVNTTINATANFTCTAIAGEIEWLVNGQPSADADVRNRGFNDQAVPLTLLNATQNLRTRTLLAFGSVDNNGSNITCVAFFLSPPFSTVLSEEAVLLVFHLGKSIQYIEHVLSTDNI